MPVSALIFYISKYLQHMLASYSWVLSEFQYVGLHNMYVELIKYTIMLLNVTNYFRFRIYVLTLSSLNFP